MITSIIFIPDFPPKIHLLRHLSWFLSKSALSTFYQTYILPILDYCDVVWSGITSTNAIKLERLQNYCARIILRRSKLSSATNNRLSLGWRSLQNRRILHIMRIILQCRMGLAPSYLSKLFQPISHSYGTRNSSSDLTIPKYNQQQTSCSFSIQTAKLWNSLPKHIKEYHPASFKTPQAYISHLTKLTTTHLTS